MSGILGDGELHAGKYNMALARRAIKNGWPISDEIRKLVVNQMALIVGRSEDERNRVAASRVLVAADAVNANREGTEVEAEKPAGDTTINVQVNTVNNALTEPEYLDFLRSRALEADSKPSPVCPDSERGPVENGQTSNGHRPGANGCNGNGKREDHP